MEARIDMLEREVNAIKSEIAVIKSTCWTRDDARVLDGRLCRIEADIAVLQTDVTQLKADVSQLKADVSQLKGDVSQLKADVAQIRIDMARHSGEMAQMESRLRTWMINLAVSLITVLSGIQIALYTVFKH